MPSERSPFSLVPILKPSIVERILPFLPRPRAAKSAIENLLAEQELDGTAQMIRTTLEAHRIRGTRAIKVAAEVYGDALRAFAQELKIEPEARHYLGKLKKVLALPDPIVAAVSSGVGSVALSRVTAIIVAEGRISTPTRERYESFARELEVPRDEALALLNSQVSTALVTEINRIASTRRIAPEDEERFNRFAADLGSTIKLSEFDQRLGLNRFRIMWAAENGRLPSIPVTIHLQRGEVCHYLCHAAWQEMRTRTTRVSYSGVGGSFRIMKGVRYRYGSYTPIRSTVDVLTPLDVGTLYITSKRVIFDGKKLSKTVTYASLLSIQSFKDAIILDKSSGKPPVIGLDDVELASVILGAALEMS